MIEKTKENTSFVINENLKTDSLEVGKANNRIKIYFDTIEELCNKISQLKEKGFVFEEFENIK